MSNTSQQSLASRFATLVGALDHEVPWSLYQELHNAADEIRRSETRYGAQLAHARTLWHELELRFSRRMPSLASGSNKETGAIQTDSLPFPIFPNRLYTSIPPFDSDFARRFCSAWNSVGFNVCTVNSAGECDTIRSWNIPGLMVQEVRRDAQSTYGRPLVFIHDLLEIIEKAPRTDHVVGIVNADIIPSPILDWNAMCKSVASGSFHCFKRAELAVLSNGKSVISPSTYRHGYDLFLWGNRESLSCQGKELEFAFGIPWWDYWFPIERLLAGDEVLSHESAWIFHESHDAKFDVSLFTSKGNQFLHYLRARKAPRLGNFAEERSLATDELCDFCTQCIQEIDIDHFRRAHAASREMECGVSVVTACMNRNANLLRSIHSWLPFEEIHEIIIVDWSSDTHVAETLAEIDDPRIRIIRIEGKDTWILSEAFNVGLREVRRGLTLKLDADVLLNPGFFDLHKPDESRFFAGNWRNARNDSEKRLNGSYFASTRVVQAAGLYNEFITTYGWDDCDLYSRMEKLAVRVDFDKEYVSHCYQEASSRISNQVSKLGLSPLEVSPDIETELEIRVNEYLALLSPDWPSCASHAYDRENARAMAYRYALLNNLAKPYDTGGLGFSQESLSELSLDALFVLFACRNNQYFLRSRSVCEIYQKLSCVPWTPTDAALISHELRSLAFRNGWSQSNSPIAIATSCERMIFRSRVRLSASDGSSCYSRLVPSSMPMVDLIPSFPGQIAMKALGKKVTSVSTVFNCDLHIRQFIEDLEMQEAFDSILFVFIVCNSRQNEFRPLRDFCARHPSNTVLVNLPNDPGLYESWNMAIASTTTDYITNWNTDDRRSPAHLRKLMDALDARPDIDLAAGALFVSYNPNTRFADAQKQGLESWFTGPDRLFTDKDLFQLNTWEEPDPSKQVVVSQNFAHCMPVWRRSMHERYGFFNEEDYGPSADWEFWLRSGRAGARFLLCGELLGVYYLNSQSYGRRETAASSDQRIISEYLTEKMEKDIRHGTQGSYP